MHQTYTRTYIHMSQLTHVHTYTCHSLHTYIHTHVTAFFYKKTRQIPHFPCESSPGLFPGRYRYYFRYSLQISRVNQRPVWSFPGARFYSPGEINMCPTFAAESSPALRFRVPELLVRSKLVFIAGLSVCMYVCTHVCMVKNCTSYIYLCMYVCISTYLHTHTRVCACMHACTCSCMHICTCMHACTCSCMHICT